MFGYKIRNVPSNNKLCGFPIVSYNKIISNLENRNINYITIDKAHNYEEVDKVNYKNKNNYNNFLIKANNYIDIINRIDKIKKYLLKDNTKLEEVENILYER